MLIARCDYGAMAVQGLSSTVHGYSDTDKSQLLPLTTFVNACKRLEQSVAMEQVYWLRWLSTEEEREQFEANYGFNVTEPVLANPGVITGWVRRATNVSTTYIPLIHACYNSAALETIRGYDFRWDPSNYLQVRQPVIAGSMVAVQRLILVDAIYPDPTVIPATEDERWSLARGLIVATVSAKPHLLFVNQQADTMGLEPVSVTWTDLGTLYQGAPSTIAATNTSGTVDTARCHTESFTYRTRPMKITFCPDVHDVASTGLPVTLLFLCLAASLLPASLFISRTFKRDLKRQVEHHRNVLEREHDEFTEKLKKSEQLHAFAQQTANDANIKATEFMAFLCHELRNPLHTIVAMLDLFPINEPSSPSGVSVMDPAVPSSSVRVYNNSGTTTFSAPQDLSDMSFLVPQTRSRQESDVRDCLEIMQSSSQYMVSIVDDILDLSKITTGKLTLQSIAFDLRALLKGLQRVHLPIAQGNGIDMILDIQGDVPPVVMSDPTRINQIMTNLIVNAIKVTPKGQVTVTVSSRTVEPSVAPPLAPNINGNVSHFLPAQKSHTFVDVTFVVQDNGSGKDELEPYLFSPYVKVSESPSPNPENFTHSRDYDGTGLGLTIAQRVANLFGSNIDVKSQEGFGSNFKFTIRMEVAPPEMELGQMRIKRDPISIRWVSDKIPQVNWQLPNETKSRGLHKVTPSGSNSSSSTTSPLVLSNVAAPVPIPALLPSSPDHPSGSPFFTSHPPQEVAEKEHPASISNGVSGSRPTSGPNTRQSSPTPPALRLEASVLPPLSSSLRTAGPPQQQLQQDRAVMAPTAVSARPLPVVLVVDDDAVNRKVLARMLASSPVRVVLAVNGAEALRLVNGELSDGSLVAILMDIVMPVMDGLTATKKLRDQGCTLPIVAITANALDADQERAKQIGMTAFMTKPFVKHDILNILNRVAPITQRVSFTGTANGSAKIADT
jgi:signal transduction histidine kinase/CheY-like chemotaxis protein